MLAQKQQPASPSAAPPPSPATDPPPPASLLGNEAAGREVVASPHGPVLTGEVEPPIDHHFAAFWSLVLKRVDKIEAQKLFRSACTKDHVQPEVIVEAMRAYAASFTTERRQYFVEPARWLRRKRWNDEPPAPARDHRQAAINILRAGPGNVAQADTSTSIARRPSARMPVFNAAARGSSVAAPGGLRRAVRCQPRPQGRFSAVWTGTGRKPLSQSWARTAATSSSVEVAIPAIRLNASLRQWRSLVACGSAPAVPHPLLGDGLSTSEVQW
jgi:hypothetical protein